MEMGNYSTLLYFSKDYLLDNSGNNIINHSLLGIEIRNDDVMIGYFIFGVLWSLFFEWILRNFSEDGKGLPTNKVRLFHVLLWPVAIFLVIRTQFTDD